MYHNIVHKPAALTYTGSQKATSIALSHISTSESKLCRYAPNDASTRLVNVCNHIHHERNVQQLSQQHHLIHSFPLSSNSLLTEPSTQLLQKMSIISRFMCCSLMFWASDPFHADSLKLQQLIKLTGQNNDKFLGSTKTSNKLVRSREITATQKSPLHQIQGQTA